MIYGVIRALAEDMPSLSISGIAPLDFVCGVGQILNSQSACPSIECRDAMNNRYGFFIFP